MKYIILLSLMGCGMKHTVVGGVSVSGLDKPIIIRHELVNSDIFKDSCETKYKDYTGIDAQDKIDECVILRENVVNQLIDSLNGGNR